MDDFSPIFRRYAESRNASPFVHRVAALSQADQLTRDNLASAALASGLAGTADAKEDLLDLLLYCIRLALADHDLTESEVTTIRHLARVFSIDEGDILARRSDEVTELLGVEMRRILQDRQVDRDEALFKVKLQEALGLSYDQFLALSRSWIEQTVGALFEEATTVEGADIHWMRERVARLDTAYDLNTFFNQQVAQILQIIGEARHTLGADGVPARSISQDTKDMVWRRDQGRCTQCGSNQKLEFDHIIPYSRGGSNTYRNIQLLCEPCNRQKSANIG